MFTKFYKTLCLKNEINMAHIKQPQPIGLELYCFVLLVGANIFSACMTSVQTWRERKRGRERERERGGERERERTTTTGADTGVEGRTTPPPVKIAKKRREKGKKEREEKRGRKEEEREETKEKGEKTRIPLAKEAAGGGAWGWAPSIFWVRGLTYPLASRQKKFYIFINLD